MTSRGQSSITLGSTTPFEIGSVSKLFTVGIYQQLQQDFGVTLGTVLGTNMMSNAVGAITLQQLAAYASGLPQDNGQCPLHSNTGYPPGMTQSLVSLFGFLQTYDTLPSPPGATFSYSNLGLALVSMAALQLDSLDTDAFATDYNSALIQYCQTFGVDSSSATPTTLIYSQSDTQALPVGYNSSYAQAIGDPGSVVECGAGGIVSTPNDMLAFLLYCMSNSYPAILQQPVWTLPDYCVVNQQTQTTLGWFMNSAQKQTIVSKDGAVMGFTSWIAMTQKNSSGVSDYGIFVLTNGPNAVTLGKKALGMILPAGSEPAVIDIPERSVDARVH